MDQVAITAVQMALGIVFLRALIGKVAKLGVFAKTVEAFGIIGAPVSLPAAAIILIMEGLASAGLLLGYRYWEALIIATVLTLLFTGAVVWAIQTNRRVDCGCFGERSGVVSRHTIHRLIVMLLGCIVSIVGIQLMNIDRFTYRDVLGAYTAATATALLALGMILFGRLTVALLDASSILFSNQVEARVR